MKHSITLTKIALLLFLTTGISMQAQLVLTGADDGSAGSLRNQVAAATEGSIIIISPLVTNIALSNGEITIDKSLVITGNGILNTTINGTANGRIFNVTNGNVVFNDLELTNGTAENGGAIYVANATLGINNSRITNSAANGTAGSGGGIYVGLGASVNVFNTTISGNRANRAGGGIETIAGTTLTLNNVTLESNNAGLPPAVASPGNGGGLHITGAGTATINGGNVRLNMAAAEGGGLWNGTGTMTIDGTTISQNTASGALSDNGGGGIYNLNSGTVNISNATISGNIANGTSGSGGGILNDVGSILVVTNSQITENTSNRAGGGIENNAGTVTLTDVTLNENTTFASPGNGGGLHVTAAGTTTINGGTVNANNAGAEGGGLWNGTGTMTIDGTTINANTASGALADQGGGGIYNLNAGTLIVRNTTISNNIANGTLGSGGGILNDVGSQLTVTNSSITGNIAVRAGAGIEDNSGTSTIVLTDVNLNNNSVTGPPGNGGGLHITGGGNATITGGTVSNNTAALEGGGLWNGSGTMTITNTTINANISQGAAADDGGAGIFNTAGTLNVSNATITNNIANGLSGSGGGIFSLAGTVTIADSELRSNSANRAGGAIEVVAGSLTITNSSLTFNDVDGGAGNPNPGNGGALHITGVTIASISGSVVSENLARREGGGLWNQTGSTMTVSNTSVNSNKASGPDATHGGGGIFNNGGTLMVNNSTIANNKTLGASGNGGGIHVKTGSATVLLTTISGNTSVNSGGGIFNNAELSVNASTVAYNNAAIGGGIANTSTVVPNLKNAIVASNTAALGTDLSSILGIYISNGYNLIGSDNTNVFIPATGDVENSNPLLAPLADNGGPTLTHALLAGSPALNAGSPTDLFNDQTGNPIFGGIRDIGSFESQIILATENFIFSNAKKSMIFPNPSVNGKVSVKLSADFGNATGRIVEIGTGKIVQQFIAENTTEVNTSALSSGMYIIHLTSDNITESHKLMIN